jgi:hypothetical protein
MQPRNSPIRCGSVRRMGSFQGMEMEPQESKPTQKHSIAIGNSLRSSGSCSCNWRKRFEPQACRQCMPALRKSLERSSGMDSVQGTAIQNQAVRTVCLMIRNRSVRIHEHFRAGSVDSASIFPKPSRSFHIPRLAIDSLEVAGTLSSWCGCKRRSFP